MSVPSGATPPDQGTVQATFAATLVDEWARSGATEAVICPGSRSTPMALALSAHPAVRVHVRIDERSAGFYALGLALGTGAPCIVATTSGTAAAELHPAVVEAHHAGVPLLVCTADRPGELQDVGAPQTIDQVHLYGRAVRWFAAPGVPEEAGRRTWRPMAARAYAEAARSPQGPGPVHLNLAFREPLVGTPGALPPRPLNQDVQTDLDRGSGAFAGAPAGTLGSADPAPMVARWRGRRGVVVAGAGCGPVASVLEFAHSLGWPVLADPRSGCRVAGSVGVGGADVFLRDPVVRAAVLPEVALVLGALPASRIIAGWLQDAADAGAEIATVDLWWRWQDPDRLVSNIVRADPTLWLTEATRGSPAPLGSDAGANLWTELWGELEETAQSTMDRELRTSAGKAADADGAVSMLSEPALARAFLPLVPSGARVLVSSSMPVRDLEAFGISMEDPPTLFANRGVNGIDGVSSTALGLAASGRGPVVCLLGDLAFLHDVSALVRAAGAPSGSTCTLVIVDNGGGGIFSLLPQAEALDEGTFEQLFGTPTLTKVVEVAGGFGVPVADVGSLAELAEALERFVGVADLAVVRVGVAGRAGNAVEHRRVFGAVGRACQGVLARRHRGSGPVPA